MAPAAFAWTRSRAWGRSRRSTPRRGLERPVQSHLNSYRRPRSTRSSPAVAGVLALSGCASRGLRTPTIPPVGPPSLRSLRAIGRFASSKHRAARKARSDTLARRGRLDADQPLSITLHDQGRAVARLSLADYAAQADTTLADGRLGVPVTPSNSASRTTRRPRWRRSS